MPQSEFMCVGEGFFMSGDVTVCVGCGATRSNERTEWVNMRRGGKASVEGCVSSFMSEDELRTKRARE